MVGGSIMSVGKWNEQAGAEPINKRRHALEYHGGDRNTCTRQEILTPCQVKQLSQKSSNRLVFAIKVVHISILFIL